MPRRSVAFGARTADRVWVRVQDLNGGKILSTRTFSVYGYTAEEVRDVVERELGKRFGAATDPDSDIFVEADDMDEPNARPKVVAALKRRKLRLTNADAKPRKKKGRLSA